MNLGHLENIQETGVVIVPSNIFIMNHNVTMVMIIITMATRVRVDRTWINRHGDWHREALLETSAASLMKTVSIFRFSFASIFMSVTSLTISPTTWQLYKYHHHDYPGPVDLVPLHHQVELLINLVVLRLRPRGQCELLGNINMINNNNLRQNQTIYSHKCCGSTLIKNNAFGKSM